MLCQEDLVIHECTPQISKLLDAFESKMGPTHHNVSWLVCTSELGFPCRRRRRFTAMIKRDLLQRCVLPHPSTAFARLVHLDCDVYLCADDKYLDTHCKQHAKWHEGLEHLASVDRWLALLTPWASTNLSRWANLFPEPVV